MLVEVAGIPEAGLVDIRASFRQHGPYREALEHPAGDIGPAVKGELLLVSTNSWVEYAPTHAATGFGYSNPDLILSFSSTKLFEIRFN